jgi:SAM-dependent methyltransferase
MMKKPLLWKPGGIGEKGAVKTWSTPVRDERTRPVPCALCGGEDFRPHVFCEGFSYVRCRRCGLVQMNPQPLAGLVRERYGAEYLAYERANEEGFLRLQLLALADGGFPELEKELLAGAPRILDLGCATGALLGALKDRGWRCTGVEISGPQADYARKERGLDVRSLPLEENDFSPGSFETVLASHLIEHLNDPAALVREVRRVLVPGGRFFVTTPNIGGFQARLFRGRWRSAVFDHLYLFSKRTLSALLEKEGFTVEKIAAWGGLAAGTAPGALKALFDRAAKRFGFGDVMILRARRDGQGGSMERSPAGGLV